MAKKFGKIEMTVWKFIRLVVFLVIAIVGFVLAHFNPQFATFGWGFTFGLVGMAILIG
ncbi:MAG: hypothetical protein NC831_07560 [Candidatus Omnitrophica bacterium]|nr:hypothetical protein [Candidatus Omnitrophota bacterium]MCM8828539.1 hypothetical protein [Candidatus Omnitrophota bacterium]